MTEAHRPIEPKVCQYCRLTIDDYEHATGLDCLDAMESDRDRLRAALAWYEMELRLGNMTQVRLDGGHIAREALRGAVHG